jgi:glycerate kinase
MRIIVAPQALKGSLTATEAGQAIALGIHAVNPEADVQIIPMADGGEGTARALVDATGGEIIAQTVTGPLDQPVQAFYGALGDGKTAVIEMAACAGLPLLTPEQRDPRITTTCGVNVRLRLLAMLRIHSVVPRVPLRYLVRKKVRRLRWSTN